MVLIIVVVFEITTNMTSQRAESKKKARYLKAEEEHFYRKQKHILVLIRVSYTHDVLIEMRQTWLTLISCKCSL